MKVLLVHPEFTLPLFSHEVPNFLKEIYTLFQTAGRPSPPFGLLYVAAVLEKGDVDVSVIDSNWPKISEEKLIKRVEKENPDIIGFSCNSYTFPKVCELSRRLKEIREDWIIVVGGPHPTLFPRESVSMDGIDFAVIGEGEYTFLELVKNIEMGESPACVRGLAFKRGKKIIVTPRRGFIENLDSLPFPARHLINLMKYRKFTRGDHIVCSRGCPYACIFCSVGRIEGKRVRCRSAQNIVDEVEHLVKKYKSKYIQFRGDAFMANRRIVMELCKELKERNIDIQWGVLARVDQVDLWILKMMKEVGCQDIGFGIESSSQRMLNFLQKGITLDQIKRAVKLCKKVGIRASGCFLIGIPGQTRRDILQDLKFALNLKLDKVCFYVLEGVPGSKLYAYLKKRQLYRKKLKKILRVRLPNIPPWEIEIYSRCFNILYNRIVWPLRRL